MTAKQKVYTYFTENRAYPSLETWKSWGYNRQYYYEVKKRWENGEDFNQPEKKKDRALLEALKMLANKDGVVSVVKNKDLSNLNDWITLIREDEEYKYYVISC